MIPLNLGAVLANRKKFVDENFTSTEGQGTETFELRCENMFHGTNFIDKSDVGYTGLINQGATCYLNSLLQTLFMIPEYRLALLSSNFEIVGDDSHNLSKQLQKLFVELQYSEKGAVSTSALTKSFGWSGRDSFVQQDVQECMTVIFDFISMQYPDSELALFLRNEWTGATQVALTCENCYISRYRSETFRDLQLQVRGAEDLYSSMGMYFEEETMDGVDCEACGGRHKHRKQPKITRLPYILSLQLRRFDMNWATMQRVKINDALRIYPSLSLNQHPEQHQGESGPIDAVVKDYELMSIMMHSGSAHSGHYFCYIKSCAQSDGPANWFLFNDSNVSAVSEEQLAIILGTSPDAERPSTQPSGSADTGNSAAKPAPTIPSANNAYMLVYREVSPVNLQGEAPCEGSALRDDVRIPLDLREAVAKDNALYLEQKAKYEYEKAFLHIMVSPVLLGGAFAKQCATQAETVTVPAAAEEGRKGEGMTEPSGSRKWTATNSANRIIRIHESCTLRQLTDQVYENFKNPPSLSPPASASFNTRSNGTGGPLHRLLPAVGVPRSCVRLRAFDSLKGTVLPPSALLPKDVADSLQTDCGVRYDQELLEDSTVLSSLSDAALKRVMHLEVRSPDSLPFGDGSQQDSEVLFTVETVRYCPTKDQTMGAESSSIFDPAVPIQLPSDCTLTGMIQRVFTSATSHSDDLTAAHIDSMVIAIHDISSGVPRQIFPQPTASTVDYNTALATSIVSPGDRVYVDFSPCQAAGEERGGLHRVGLMEYFEKLENSITIYFSDISTPNADENSRISLAVDRRCVLSEVKEKMAFLLNRSMDSFVLLRMENSQTDTTVEIKNLSTSLAHSGYDDGSFILIRSGTPLLPGEYRVNFLMKSLDTAGSVDSCDTFVSMGCESILRGDQTVSEVKDWLRRHRAEHFAPYGDNTNIRLQLAQKFTEVGGNGQGNQEGGSQQYFKTTFVLDDEKSLRDCLGNQLKDGVHLSVTAGVSEERFCSRDDLFISLWEWDKSLKQVVFHGDVVVAKTSTFAELKRLIQSVCQLSTTNDSFDTEAAINTTNDKRQRHLMAGDIFFAKPFTWQLKDPSANIPLLKWSSQPTHDELTITGAPYRLTNAPLAGPALLLFKCCHPSELIEDKDEASSSAVGIAVAPEEVGFRLYSAEEQQLRRTEEERQDRERKALIEEKLKALSQSGLVNTMKSD